MRTLITGGLGFIGSQVASCMEQINDTVIVDSKTNYNFHNTETMRQLHDLRGMILSSPILEADLSDPIACKEVMLKIKPDRIIHLAAYPNQKLVAKNPQHASALMSEALINMIEWSRHNCKKFVYISSSMVYGNFKDRVKETADCNPIGLYGTLKLAGEHIVSDYARQGYFNHVIIRPSAVYGPTDTNDRVIAKFIMSAMQDQKLYVRGAEEILDFTYVKDLAEGIVQATTGDCKYPVYNMTRCQKHRVNLEQAANTIIDVVGSGHYMCEDRDDSMPMRGRLNCDRARNDLGYNPKTDFAEGIEQYHHWLKINDSIYRS